MRRRSVCPRARSHARFVTTAEQLTIASRSRGSDYAALGREVRSAGLLDRRPVSYAVRVAASLGLYAASWAAIIWVGDSWRQTVTAVALGIAFTQVAFLGHDSGHQQIFAARRANDLFGRLVGNLLIVLSYGWWVGKHNRHHANPNKEHHDPDIGDGILAFTTEQVASRTGRLGRFITRRQAWLFFPLLTLEGLNLHLESVRSLRCHGDRSVRGGNPHVELLLLTASGRVPCRAAARYVAAQSARIHRHPPSGLGSVHGVLVRAEPQRHADHRCAREARLPPPASPHLT